MKQRAANLTRQLLMFSRRQDRRSHAGHALFGLGALIM